MKETTITAVGLSDWEQSFLQATIQIASGTDIGAWRWLAEAAQAQVVVAGAGTREGTAWLRQRADGATTAIVVEVHEPGDTPGDGPALARPVGRSHLVTLLKSLERTLREPPVAVVPVAPAAPAIEDTVPSIEPRHLPLLLSDLQPAAVQPAAVQPAGDVALLPEGTAPVEPPLLRPMAAQPGPPPVTQPAAQPEPQPEPPPSPGDTARILPKPVLQVDAMLVRKGRRAARFYANSRLLGLLRNAIDTRTAVEVTHATYPLLRVFPARGLYTAAADPAEFADMFRVAVGEFRAAPIPPSMTDPLLRAGGPRPLAALLYLAARHGAEGRLPPDADVQDELELAAPPAGLDGLVSLAMDPLLRRMVAGPVTLRELALDDPAGMDALIDELNGLEAMGCLRRRRHGELLEPVAVPQGEDTATTMNRLRALFSGILPGSRAGS